MMKILLVALREIRQKIRQRGYIISTLALPIILIAIGLLTEGIAPNTVESIESPSGGRTSIGIVDQADLIHTFPEELPDDRFENYSSLESAQAALRDSSIEAYYVIRADYRQSGAVQRVSMTLDPDPADTQMFEWLLIHNLDPELKPEQVSRLRWPYNAQGVETIKLDPLGDGREVSDSMMPYFIGIIVMMPLFTSGSYLFQSLTQEKSGRVLEVLLVSLRPRQMLAGKVLGFGGLVIIQYIVWTILGAIAALLTGGEVFGLFENIRLGGRELIWIVPFALGGFLLYAGIMAGLGAMAKDMDSSRVWIFIISLPMFIPFYLGTAIAQSPNGPLAVALSLIPFSAPVAMMLRLTSTSVPLWQLGLSVVLLLLLGLGMIALMARLFKAQTLLSGENLSVRKFIRALA